MPAEVLTTLGRYRLRTFLFLAIGAGIMGVGLFSPRPVPPSEAKIWGIMLLAMIPLVAAIWHWLKVKTTFKTEVIRHVLRHRLPAYAYEPEKAIAREVVIASRMFPKNPVSYVGEDYFRVQRDRYVMEFSELSLIFFRAGRALPDVSFRGVFVTASCPVRFAATVVILPRTLRTFYEMVMTESARCETWTGGQRLVTQDHEFERDYNVYAGDPREARRYLGPEVLEVVKGLAYSLGTPHLRISWTGNRVHVAAHYGQLAADLFEPPALGLLNTEAMADGFVDQVRRFEYVAPLVERLLSCR